jgi:hypothetical protein
VASRACLFTSITLAMMIAWPGCDDGSKRPADSVPAARTAAAPQTQPLIPKMEMIDWCREHAVPESVCTRCNPSLIAQFKSKGDWCSRHDLPESQCFICHPELEAKFAAEYKAKYGKEPPATAPET